MKRSLSCLQSKRYSNTNEYWIYGRRWASTVRVNSLHIKGYFATFEYRKCYRWCHNIVEYPKSVVLLLRQSSKGSSQSDTHMGTSVGVAGVAVISIRSGKEGVPGSHKRMSHSSDGIPRIRFRFLKIHHPYLQSASCGILFLVQTVER